MLFSECNPLCCIISSITVESFSICFKNEPGIREDQLLQTAGQEWGITFWSKIQFHYKKAKSL